MRFPNFKEMPSYERYPRMMMAFLLVLLWLAAIPVSMTEIAKGWAVIIPLSVVLVLVSFMGVMIVFRSNYTVRVKATHYCTSAKERITEEIGTTKNHWNFCPDCGQRLTNIEEVK